MLLSSGGRLSSRPTSSLPGAPALALQAQNDLNQIIVDDASQTQNPDPIVFGRGGQPLSASNTLRGGDTATGIVGVMTYTWAGNSASPNAYRVRPINALGGYINFEAANPRPTSAPEVGGTTKVVGMNLLNFFNTFADGNAATPGCFPSGTDADCRGASSQTEFDRQWVKTVAAIVAMDADVVGFNEIENDGYGPDSSIAFLVDKLNAATAPGTYAFIDADAGTGQVNALGNDAIRVGMIYKPGKRYARWADSRAQHRRLRQRRRQRPAQPPVADAGIPGQRHRRALHRGYQPPQEQRLGLCCSRCRSMDRATATRYASTLSQS